ncbi:hypothetical protein D3C85_781650 [compost metagenome]
MPLQGLGLARDTFFHTQGFAVVGEEVRQHAQIAVAIALEQCHGLAVVGADLQPHVGASMILGAGFGRVQQALADAVATGTRVGGNGMQAGEGTVLAEQQQGVPEDATVTLGHGQAGIGLDHHPAELLSAQPGDLEAAALELRQRRQVVERGGTHKQVHGRSCKAGKESPEYWPGLERCRDVCPVPGAA